MQHCLVVFTSKPASVRQRAIGHNVLVHHLNPLFTVDFQAKLQEVQSRQEPMMPETITLRVVAVCDAVAQFQM